LQPPRRVSPGLNGHRAALPCNIILLRPLNSKPTFLRVSRSEYRGPDAVGIPIPSWALSPHLASSAQLATSPVPKRGTTNDKPSWMPCRGAHQDRSTCVWSTQNPQVHAHNPSHICAQSLRQAMAP